MRWTRLGRLAQTISGVGFPPVEQGQADGDLPFLKVSDLALVQNRSGVKTAVNWVSIETSRRLGVRVVPVGAIIFPKVGAALLGNARGITERACAIDNNMMAVVPRSGDPRFWFYYLSSLDFALLDNGGALPFVSDSAVRDLRVPEIPLDMQRRIADFLDDQVGRLDRMIALREKQVILVEQKSLRPLRQVLAEAAGLGDSPLPWLPSWGSDWELLKLSWVAACYDGQRVPLSAEQRAARRGSFPYYGASRIVDHIDDYLFDGQFVLVGEDGASLDNPNFDVVQLASGRFWVNNHAHVLQGRTVMNEYLAEYLRCVDRPQLVSGATRPKITQDDLMSIRIAVPPKSVQHQLAESCDVVRENNRVIAGK